MDRGAHLRLHEPLSDRDRRERDYARHLRLGVALEDLLALARPIPVGRPVASPCCPMIRSGAGDAVSDGEGELGALSILST